MPLFRRTHTESPKGLGEGVLWGVPRHEAASDRDDPLLHAGLIQHAFVLGNDERAICGFRPPVRSGFGGGRSVPQLALPGPDNPRCSKCQRLLATVASTQVRTGDSPEDPETDSVSAGTSNDKHLEAPVAMDPEHSPEREGDPSSDTLEAAGRQSEPESTRDDAKTPKRSSVRRAGRVTVPQGRRSIVTRMPAGLHGAVVTADIDGSKGDLRVQSVRVADDGTVRITLNQRTSAPIGLVLYMVSGPQRE